MLWGPYNGPELRRFELMSQYHGQSARERALQELEACWLGVQYDDRSYAWDGVPVGAQGVARSRPQDLPERCDRVPCFQSKLGGLIVRRFTDMLFAEGRRPAITVVGDAATTDWISAAWEQAGGWGAMLRARDHAGAMGTAVVLVRLKDGEYRLDPLNPRCCTPTWADRREQQLASLEERCQYVQEVEGPDGVRRDKRFWYRRVIDGQQDRIWRGVPVRQDEGSVTVAGEADREPRWGEPAEVYDHGLGVCPVVWTQNEQVDEEVDGKADIDGQPGNIEQLDYLLSEEAASTIANLDATVVLTRTAADDVGALRTGRFTTLCLPEEGATASFLELSGAGLEAGAKQAVAKRQTILQACQCVELDPADLPGMGQGAESMAAVYRPMIERCNRLRTQYAEMLRRICRLVVLLGQKARAVLPDKVTKDAATGKETSQPRRLGPKASGASIEITWGPYFPPTGEDRKNAVGDADVAKRSGLLQLRTLIRHLAPFFGVEDVEAELQAIEEEREAQQEARLQAGAAMFGGAQAGGQPGRPGNGKPTKPLPPGQRPDDEPTGDDDEE